MSTTDLSGEPVPPPFSSDVRAILRVGAGIVVFTFVILGGWAAVARIDSAVVAEGAVSVESYRKTIQHLEGGIVRDILVRDGDLVRAGDVLLRLDPTKNEATDRTVRQQRAIALAQQARLIAQRDMRDEVAFAREVTEAADDRQIAIAMNDNVRQFETRRENLVQSVTVLERQIAQAIKEVEQSQADRKVAEDQLRSVGLELPNLRGLLEKGLVALPRVTALERQEMQLRGALETAAINRGKALEKIAELRARIAQLRQDYLQEAATALLDVRKVLGDLAQQMVVARDALERIEIRAPVAGTVQQLRIFTVGGVIRPGDAILDLVPQSDTLVVRARVATTDIDRVREGLPVEIRIPQFTQFQIKPVTGAVRSLSRDSLWDDASKSSYFAVEIAVERASVPGEIAGKLTAGMPVQALILTEARTVLQYLVAPLVDRVAVSLRER